VFSNRIINKDGIHFLADVLIAIRQLPLHLMVSRKKRGAGNHKLMLLL